jgi:F-type H+-transporting ATPase subunit epsilon
LHIDVVTPYGIIFTGSAKSCTAPGVDGEFSILSHHAALLSIIDIGELRFTFENNERSMATAGGFLEVKDNNINIIAESAEWAEDIEIDRAQAAEKRARELIDKREGIDITRAQLALARALNRTKIASHL